MTGGTLASGRSRRCYFFLLNLAIIELSCSLVLGSLAMVSAFLLICAILSLFFGSFIIFLNVLLRLTAVPFIGGSILHLLWLGLQDAATQVEGGMVFGLVSEASVLGISGLARLVR